MRAAFAHRWLAAAALSALAGLATAQVGTPMSEQQIASERARLAAERARVAERFAAEERACHQRFAVNDCLRRNQAWQREQLGELRRQEILLNDNERQRRAAERLERLDAKQQAAPPAAAAPADVASPAPRAAPAPGRKPEPGSPAPSARDPAEIARYQDALRRKQERAAAAAAEHAAEAAAAQQEARRHAERVRAAEERRARIEQRNAADPSRAAPLPTPAP